MFKLVKKQDILSILTASALLLTASAAVAAGDHADSSAVMKDFMWRVIDFAFLVAILVWAMKKADFKGKLSDRQKKIEQDLQEAGVAREAAEAKLKEYSEKLDKANQEVDQLRESMLKDAELEKQRIIAEAEASAAKVVAQAAQAADQEVLKARAALRTEAARLAVELAAGKLNNAVVQADHDRMVEDYLGKVVQL